MSLNCATADDDDDDDDDVYCVFRTSVRVRIQSESLHLCYPLYRGAIVTTSLCNKNYFIILSEL